MAASQLCGGHGPNLPAYKLWPGTKVRLMGGVVDILEVNEADPIDGEAFVSIRYRVDYAGGTCLIGVSLVPALRVLEQVDDGEPF
jgi:hypothetical protein